MQKKNCFCLATISLKLNKLFHFESATTTKQFYSGENRKGKIV